MSLKLHLFFSCFPGLANNFDSKIHLRNIYIHLTGKRTGELSGSSASDPT